MLAVQPTFSISASLRLRNFEVLASASSVAWIAKFLMACGVVLLKDGWTVTQAHTRIDPKLRGLIGWVVA